MFIYLTILLIKRFDYQLDIDNELYLIQKNRVQLTKGKQNQLDLIKTIF